MSVAFTCTRTTRILAALLMVAAFVDGFSIGRHSRLIMQESRYGFQSTTVLLASGDDGAEEEASKLRAQADELRDQIRKMEDSLGEDRPRGYDIPAQPAAPVAQQEEGMSLKNKRILVVGANGRLGSMVCRYLLRNNPQTEVVAAVHYVGEESPTARGYGRLSYEVGAEDGIGSIGAAWSEERTATFRYSDEMKDYNLRNLRLVEVELLDPLQANTVTEGVDAVIWCATDFNGNKPRAVSGLNVAFLFRALADPTKGRVEIEGLRNILGGLRTNKQNKSWTSRISSTGSPEGRSPSDPIDFVLVSTAPEAYKDFETPYGTFNGLKREGEEILNEFPSLSSTVLQMSKYDDNFVEESLDIIVTDATNDEEEDEFARSRRRINRRDAARAAVSALTDESLLGKTTQIWTDTR